MRGQYVEPITDDLKEKFLDLVASGYTRPEAAEALGTSARQLRAICNPDSQRYDPDFARRYAKLTEKDGEHQTALIERLRSATIERGLRSSDRLLEKLNVIYDPDWAVHRPQSMQINFNVDQFRAEITGATDKELEEYIERKQAELEAGEIIDAELDDDDEGEGTAGIPVRPK